MNPEPTLADWLRTFVVLGGGTVVILALAALAAWPMRSGVGRRTVWQAATLALVVLVLAETTGLAGGVCVWLATPPPPHRAEEHFAAEWPAVPPPELEAEPEEIADDPTLSLPPIAQGVWWPAWVWLAGAALASAWFGGARLLLLRLRQRPVNDSVLRERCDGIARRLGMRGRVRLVECDGLAGPAAFGVVWPAVALPVRFAEEFTPAQQEAVLAHELGHLAGRDPAWRLLSDAVTALLWWHPLAWEARVRLRAAGEEAADEASVVVPDGPALLADCLVRLGRRLSAAGAGALERMAGGGFRSGLGRRVERLLGLDCGTNRTPGRWQRLLVLTLTPLLVPAAVMVTTAWAQARSVPEGDEPMSAMQRSWRRSLAAMVVVAALGAGPDTPAGDPPAEGGGRPRPAEREGAEGREEEKKDPVSLAIALKEREHELATAVKVLEAVAERRVKLQQRLAQYQAVGAKATEPGYQKVETELRALEEEAKRLRADTAVLEEKVNELRAEKNWERDTPRTKVFRLAHRDPVEVHNVLERLLPRDTAAAGEGGPMGAGMAPPGMGAFGGRGGDRGDRGARGQMGGMGGFFAGRPSWRVAVDRRTNSLFVRGSEADLKTAADFVAMLDVADGKPPPQMKNIRAFHLKFADAETVTRILESLELGALVAPVKKGKMIVVSGPEQTLKEVAELVAAIDVEK